MTAPARMGHVIHDPVAGPCAAIPLDVLYSGVSSKALRLYGHLVFYADESTDGLFPTRRVMADLLGVRELRGVTRLVRELDAVGALATLALAPRPTLTPGPDARRRKADQEAAKAFRRIGERDGFRCRVCGTDRTLTVDHVIAVANGGTDDDDNLQLLCRSHNSSKGAR